MIDRRAPSFWVAAIATFALSLFLGGNRPEYWAPYLGVVALALLVQLGVRHDRGAAILRWRVVAAAALYLGVMLYGAVQASGLTDAGSIDPAASWRGVARFGGYAMLFLIALSAASHGPRARQFIDAVALWTGAVCLYAIAAHLSGWNPLLGAAEAYGELEGPFVNRNAFALYAGIGLIANLAALLRRVSSDPSQRSYERRQGLRVVIDSLEQGGWLFVLGAAAAGLAIALSQSRGGAAAAAVGLVVFSALYLPRRRLISRGFSRAVLALSAVIAVLGLGGLISRLGRIDAAEDGRLLVFANLLEPIAARPWTGWGLGAFRDAFRPYAPREFASYDWDLAHNSYLENAVEIGVIGAAALALAAALILWEAGLGARRRRRFLEAPALAAAVGAAGATHAMVDFALQMPATTALWVMILGVGCAQAQSSNMARRVMNHRRKQRVIKTARRRGRGTVQSAGR